MNHEICHCECHTPNSTLKHILPCCVTCATCKMSTARMFIEEHTNRHTRDEEETGG